MAPDSRYHAAVHLARVTVALLLTLAGCASTPAPINDLVIPAGGYATAFQAAKDTLRNFEFELDRTDAREGVITTAPRAWSGAATPWIPHAGTARDAVEGLAQFEQRTARVVFRPSDDAAAPIADLRDFTGSITAEVSVTVERLYRPGRRADATSVRLTGFTSDPSKNPIPGPPAAFAVEQRKDTALASRVQQEIRRAENWNIPIPSETTP